MKILYFYQYFSTSEGAWGTRVYEFTKNWVTQGHEVTVVSSIYSKSDLKAEKLTTEQNIDGIRVKAINVLIDNRQPVHKRLFTFLQYALISSWYALTLPADIVIASSGPITVGIPGLIAKWFRGRKLVFEARDLWPEGAIRMGLLKNRLAINFAYWFEKLCYKNSSAIVGLSPGIQEDIQKRFNHKRVVSVTNAANIELFSRRTSNGVALVPGSYAIYFGNIGEVNHSEFLVETGIVLSKMGRHDIKILLIGDGQLREKLTRRLADEKIGNVHWMGLMPKSHLVSYVQNAIASVIPLKPLPVFDTSSPNKLFESMAAGVPVIQTTQGWIKEFLDKNGGGFTVSANAPEELAATLIKLKDNPDYTSSVGKKAAIIAKEQFDKNFLAGKMLRVLEEVHDEG